MPFQPKRLKMETFPELSLLPNSTLTWSSVLSRLSSPRTQGEKGDVLEFLNRELEGNEAFFKLQKGSRKANNAQKEKRRLARKRCCAAKEEREREAAKAATLPPVSDNAWHVDASSGLAKPPENRSAPSPKWHAFRRQQLGDRRHHRAHRPTTQYRHACGNRRVTGG